MLEAMNRAITLHKMKPVVDRAFGYEQTRDALQHMESGQHFGKIVVDVNR
jgi:NADPH:quinone reductase-like Zn-dependent oxidoreductase